MSDDERRHDPQGAVPALATGDYLVRAMGLGRRVRALAVRSTETCNAIVQRHGSLPTAAAATCRLATSCLLLGGTIKGREQISIEIKGNGPLRNLYGVADAQGAVRVALDNPMVDLPPLADGKFDVPNAVGMGQLMVTKNLGLKEPYQGVVPLVSGGIARDMVEYFMSSEQKPAAMALGEVVDLGGVSAAGGYLLQLFPDADEERVAELEQEVARLPPVSELISSGVSPEAILRQLLPDLEILEHYPVGFRCVCSAERFERLLVALGEGELRDMLEQDEGAELRCHFCNNLVTFDREALQRLLIEARSGIN